MEDLVFSLGRFVLRGVFGFECSKAQVLKVNGWGYFQFIFQNLILEGDFGSGRRLELDVSKENNFDLVEYFKWDIQEILWFFQKYFFLSIFF